MQRSHETTIVPAMLQRLTIAGIAAQELHVVGKTVGKTVVDPECRPLPDHLPIQILQGIDAGPFPLPAPIGLDVEQVVTADAGDLLDDLLSPPGLQRRLCQQKLRTDAEPARRPAGLGPEVRDELHRGIELHRILCWSNGRCALHPAAGLRFHHGPEGKPLRNRVADRLIVHHPVRTVTLPQLFHQHLCDADPPLVRQLNRQLAVVHLPIEIELLAVEQGITETAVPNAFQHHLHEQRLELPGHGIQRLGRVPAAQVAQPREPLQIGVDIGRSGDHAVTPAPTVLR